MFTLIGNGGHFEATDIDHANKERKHGVERQDDRDHRDPLRRTVEADEVGRTALMLASDYTTAITGEVLYVDAGFHVAGMVFH